MLKLKKTSDVMCPTGNVSLRLFTIIAIFVHLKCYI